MRALTIRLAYIIIMGAFVSMGILIILAGQGNFDIYILKVIGVTATIPTTNNGVVTVGYFFVGIVLLISFLLSINATIDSKDLPIKLLSRVIVQNKILLIADGKVFEKQTIEWADVGLMNVRRETHRNFYRTSLMEDLYIDLREEVIYELKTEDLTPNDEIVPNTADEQIRIDKINDFKMGADDAQQENQDKETP